MNAINESLKKKKILMGILFVEIGLLGLSNKLLQGLHLHERVMRPPQVPQTTLALACPFFVLSRQREATRTRIVEV